VDGLIANMPNFQRVRFLADLKIAVEWAKVALSKAPSVRIIPPTPLLNNLGIPIMVDVELTREQFEEIITPLVERTIPICHDAIRYAEYTPDLIDMVLLVGGSSQIPLVQDKVREAFGADKVVVHPRPMYAVAEGAALVAAGLTENVGTVSRDYYIKLVDGMHKVISRGEVLPFTTAQTFKTVVDGQRLIRLELFNGDDQRNLMEPIGKMWLPLYQRYPKGTEILVTLELNEQMGDLQITAILKNDTSVKVSSLLSRGGTDEKINDDVDEIIQEINDRELSSDAVEEFSQQVIRVIQTTNQIVDPSTGEEREDLRRRAYQKYQDLRASVSEERNIAANWAYECDFLVQTYGFLIEPAQQERLRSLALELREAVYRNNLSAMEAGVEAARREISNLSEDMQLIRSCRNAISIANRISPMQGEAINDKKDKMLAALQRRDRDQADRIWMELLPDVQYWLYQRPDKATIQTELTK
jgi:molecular chaperone DnaK